jgi:hypothetical protein
MLWLALSLIGIALAVGIVALSKPKQIQITLMSVFVHMDRMMSRHFEEGLAALKAAAESRD